MNCLLSIWDTACIPRLKIFLKINFTVLRLPFLVFQHIDCIIGLRMAFRNVKIKKHGASKFIISFSVAFWKPIKLPENFFIPYPWMLLPECHMAIIHSLIARKLRFSNWRHNLVLVLIFFYLFIFTVNIRGSE